MKKNRLPDLESIFKNDPKFFYMENILKSKSNQKIITDFSEESDEIEGSYSDFEEENDLELIFGTKDLI